MAPTALNDTLLYRMRGQICALTPVRRAEMPFRPTDPAEGAESEDQAPSAAFFRSVSITCGPPRMAPWMDAQYPTYFLFDVWVRISYPAHGALEALELEQLILEDTVQIVQTLAHRSMNGVPTLCKRAMGPIEKTWDGTLPGYVVVISFEAATAQWVLV